ncbi:hypothetical protein ACIQ2D_08620 [Lysinibacillus sp. NPDC097287]|uniref:phage tail protein n=1 Tax=Lysinibacillus sp. NPDC097287 TaxID=3364144 RepID=UPI00381EF70D
MDGLKEGRIVAAEFGQGIDKAMQDAIKGTNISAEQLEKWGQAVASGGQGGVQAIQEMNQALSLIDDDTKRNEIGVKMYGTLWEEQGGKISQTIQGMNEHIRTAAQNTAELNSDMSALESDPAYRLSVAIGGIKEALAPVLATVGELIAKIATWASENTGLVLTIAAIGTVVGILVGAFALLMPAIGAVVTILPTIASAGGIVTAAMGALSAVFAPLGAAIAAIASPISLAIAAIVAIGVALVAAYNEVEWFRDGVNEVWGQIKEYTTTAFNAVKEVISSILKSAIDLGKSIIADFKEFWATNGEAIVSSVKNQFEVIKTVIQGAMKVIQGVFQVAWPIISNFVKVAFEVIKGVIKTGMDLAKGVITTAMKVINGDWKGAWESIKKTVSDIAKNIVSTLKAINLVQVGKDIINGLIKGISSMASGAIEAITGVVNGVVNKAKKLLDIHSPSRVFMAIGSDTVEGMEIGMEGRKKNLDAVMTDLTNSLLDITDHYKGEEKKISETANAEIAKIEQRSKENVDKIYRDAYAKKRKTTQDENIKIQRLQEDAAKKIADIEKKSVAESVSLMAKEQKDKLEQTKLFIQDRKTMDELSLIDEAYIWEQSLNQFGLYTKERVEAQKAYQAAVQAINKEVTAINTDYSNQINKINEDLIKQEETLTKAYADAVDKRAQSLNSFKGLFDAFKAEIDVTGEELLANLGSQVDGFKTWQVEIEKLSEKAIDKGLIEELRQMGPNALPQLMALNQLTDAQLTQYSKLYKEKSKLARTQAETELVGMKDDTDKQIKGLRDVANKQLDTLQQEWNTKIQSLTKSTSTELSSLKQVGIDAGNGLLQGLSSTADSIQKKALEIANSVKNTIQSALDIHSPSRVTMGFGVNVNEGLIKGMEQSQSRLQKAMNNAYGSLASSAAKSANINTGNQAIQSRNTTHNSMPVNVNLNYSGNASMPDIMAMVDIIERELGNRLNNQLRLQGSKG